ncbi:MAG: glycosyltransferase family 9 protein [Myxococcota bacterium]
MTRSATTRPRRPAAPAAARILIVRLGALGDVVRTLPAASALRDHYAEAHLAWLVEAKSAGVLRSQPWIDEVLELPRAALSEALAGGRIGRLASELGRFASELRSRRFDLVVDFHSILKSGVASWLTRAPVRAGYAPPLGREGSWWFANRRAPSPAHPISRFARNAALVRALGVEAPERSAPLQVSEAARARADAALAESGLGRQSDWVALHPGSSGRAAHKRWSVEGFAALARALRAQRGLECRVLRGAGSEEQARAEAVVAASGGAARLAPAGDGPDALAALLARASLHVGGDSGPLHVASLVGTPVVQIMGSTHPVENTPWPRTPWRRVRIPVACSPCRRGCAAAHCLSVVPPESVVEAALALLDETGGARVRLAG